MNIVSGMLSFDLADSNLEQRLEQPVSMFSSGRVEIEGEETWADIHLVRQSDDGSQLTPQPGGWWGTVVVGEEWFAILRTAFLTSQTYLLNVSFRGTRSDTTKPLALKDISLTLMRSAATTEESAA